jgi:sugar/nucleoside kinase (ribokinase family)
VGAPAFLDWVRGTDLLLCNADEAAALAGADSPVGQAQALTAVAGNVVVKLGAAGAVWCDRSGDMWSVPGAGGPVADPTGAGDAFAAGLLAAWCRGLSPAEALAAGAALGAAAVSRVGARPGA